MFIRKYGLATHIYIPIVKRAVVDFAVSADWPTPAAGDVKISKDGGAAANVTNLPAPITMGNTAMWDFSLTAAEMQADKIVITVADAATKLVEDQAIIIETRFGPITNFQFMMTDSATHSPLSGLGTGPVPTRSIDGAAFATGGITNVAEIGSGIYRMDIAASDLAGNNTTFKITGSSADVTFVTMMTMLQ